MKARDFQTLRTTVRSITLLNVVSKLFENIIMKLFNEFLNDHSLLPNHQLGFREVHSTFHQLKRVVGHIKTNRNSQRSTGIVLLNVEKAFDSVWNEGLLHKLVVSNCNLCLSSKVAHIMFVLTKSIPLPILFPMASFEEVYTGLCIIICMTRKENVRLKMWSKIADLFTGKYY
jgi:hypothetical protein